MYSKPDSTMIRVAFASRERLFLGSAIICEVSRSIQMILQTIKPLGGISGVSPPVKWSMMSAALTGGQEVLN